MKKSFPLRPLALLAFALYTAVPALAADPAIDEGVARVAHRWAAITYQMPEGEREAAFKTLVEQARSFAAANPGKPEPMIWQAISLAGYAKANGGIGALSAAREARDLLLAAEKIDPNALNGSIYTSLGSLYAKVPGWPVGFGDKKKAREYLEKAVAMNPQGMDANYLYADFLADQGEYAKAAARLKLAQVAPPRPGREDADKGRLLEVESLLAELQRRHPDALAAAK